MKSMRKKFIIISAVLIGIFVLQFVLLRFWHYFKPHEASASNLPIGIFSGSKADIDAIKDVYLKFSVMPDWYKYTATLPESYIIDPESIPEIARADLKKQHLWNGEGKINIWALAKIGDLHFAEGLKAQYFLWESRRKHPEEFESALKLFRSIPASEKITPQYRKNKVNAIKNPVEKEIFSKMLFLREVEGFCPEYINTIANGPEPIAQVKATQIKERMKRVKKTLDVCIIGISVSGNRATLLYSAPEGFLLHIVKFAKLNGEWKIIAIDEHPKLTESDERAVVNYWENYHNTH